MRTARTPKNARATHEAQLVAIDSLKPYPGNARVHDLEGIRESLRVNTQYRPVVVRTRTRHVLAGNGTIEAAKAEGWSEVWATFIDCDAKAAKRINLVDNRLNDLAGWDEQALAAQLGSLPGVEGTGWSERELVSFYARTNPPAPGGDTEPIEPPSKPTTKLHDLWVLGDHRLVCGDGTVAADVEQLMGGDVADATVTDPPYCSGGFQESGRATGSVGTSAVHKQVANDRLSTRGYIALLRAAFGAIPTPYLYVFTDWRMWVTLFDVAESSGFSVRSMIVWDKGSPGMGRGWRSQHELIMWGAKATPPWDKHAPGVGNVIGELRTGNPLHTTQKPVALIEKLLDNSPFIGAVVDPFAGSGSTLIACENLSRRCYAMEIDPGYCDVIVDRFKRHCPDKPVRLESAKH